ncbi:hypothetical protein [Streptomyces mayteni]
MPTGRLRTVFDWSTERPAGRARIDRVFQHVVAPRRALAEARRAVAAGG